MNNALSQKCSDVNHTLETRNSEVDGQWEITGMHESAARRQSPLPIAGLRSGKVKLVRNRLRRYDIGSCATE